MSTDAQIETEIVAKGLVAPRVTPDRIADVILSEHYFTAAEAAGPYGAGAGQPPIVGGLTRESAIALSLLTICVLVLQNGFTVTGESACASPENFDADLGRKIARKAAVDKVWALEGYALKSRLAGA